MDHALDHDQHRDKARECVSLARQVHAAQERLELLNIAQAFLRLAAFTTQHRGVAAKPAADRA